MSGQKGMKYFETAISEGVLWLRNEEKQIVKLRSALG
jgi:hypothetical protein